MFSYVPIRKYVLFLGCLVFVGCSGTMDKITDYIGISGGSWLKTIKINARKDMNQSEDALSPEDVASDPCKLAIVFGNNEILQGRLLEMSSVDFFNAVDQLQRDHKDELYVVIEDVLPGDVRTIKIKPTNTMQENIYNKATFMIGFVSYQAPGNHRFAIPKGAPSVRINFDANNVAVVVPEQK